MIVTIADQWLVQNAGRRYPIADDSETVFYDASLHKDITIPDTAILDFRCVLHGIRAEEPPTAILTYVGSFADPDGRFVKFGDVVLKCGDTQLTSLRFEVPRELARNTPYVAYAENDYASGVMTVSYSFADIPYGTVNAAFAKTTVVVDNLGVDSVKSTNSVDKKLPVGTEKISGEIHLDLGYNTDPYIDGNRLRIDITKGGGIGENWQKQTGTQTCDNVMFTINGERPGSDGDIKLVGESGITVIPRPEEHAIEIAIPKTAADILAKTCKTKC